ncbi:hypothetical protein HR45_00995 [Shewanella mangrovi]|uniref:Uncharacterized protein n=1 Tax=Shewanella mangrovi TaxID=1515746 RepID=A0A094JIH7_9GAMM|nr:hypothetical protein HR45_00995 [Shewanella mangrovi]
MHLSPQADELLVIESQDELSGYFGNDQQLLLNNDLLLDSQQHVFVWRESGWHLSASVIDMDWLQRRVQQHVAAADVCCISKFSLHNLHDAITVVKSTS